MKEKGKALETDKENMEIKVIMINPYKEIPYAEAPIKNLRFFFQ